LKFGQISWSVYTWQAFQPNQMFAQEPTQEWSARKVVHLGRL